MELLTALTCGGLVAAGVWLILGRDRAALPLGALLLAGAVSLALIATGGLRASGPAVGPSSAGPSEIAATAPDDVADPVPGAFALALLLPALGAALLLWRRGEDAPKPRPEKAPPRPAPEPPRTTRPQTPATAPRTSRHASGGGGQR